MKQLHLNLLVFVISLLVMLVLLEAGVRIFVPQALFDECNKQHLDWPRPMIISDELLGWKAKPLGSWCLYQPDTNKKITISTNSQGIRSSKEFRPKKPAGTFRVLVYGDSFVWGENLAREETFAVQLQKELEKQFEKTYLQVEVIPFALGGYGPPQNLLHYYHVGKNYNADLVLHLFYHNDFEEIFINPGASYPRPIFRYENKTFRGFHTAEDIATGLRKGKRDHLFKYYGRDHLKKGVDYPFFRRFLLSNSHSFIFLNKMTNKREEARKEKEANVDRLLTKVKFSDEDAFKFFLKLPSVQTNRFVEHVSYLLHIFRRETNDNGANYVLVSVPSKYQVHDKYRGLLKKRLSLLRQDADTFFSTPEKHYILSKIVAERNIPYIDLGGVAYKNQEKFYHLNEGHWNPYGVSVSAQYVAQELQEKGFTS